MGTRALTNAKKATAAYFDLENGRSCLLLEREHRQVVDILAYKDGWNNWREFFCMQVLAREPKDMPLASFVKRAIFTYPIEDFDFKKSAP